MEWWCISTPLSGSEEKCLAVRTTETKIVSYLHWISLHTRASAFVSVFNFPNDLQHSYIDGCIVIAPCQKAENEISSKSHKSLEWMEEHTAVCAVKTSCHSSYYQMEIGIRVLHKSVLCVYVCWSPIFVYTVSALCLRWAFPRFSLSPAGIRGEEIWAWLKLMKRAAVSSGRSHHGIIWISPAHRAPARSWTTSYRYWNWRFLTQSSFSAIYWCN